MPRWCGLLGEGVGGDVGAGDHDGQERTGHGDRGGGRIRGREGKKREPPGQERGGGDDQSPGDGARPGAPAVDEAADEAAGGERGGNDAREHALVVAFGHGDGPHIHGSDRETDTGQGHEQQQHCGSGQLPCLGGFPALEVFGSPAPRRWREGDHDGAGQPEGGGGGERDGGVVRGGERGHEQGADDVQQALCTGVEGERGVPQPGVGQHARPQRPQPGFQGRCGQTAADDDGDGEARSAVRPGQGQGHQEGRVEPAAARGGPEQDGDGCHAIGEPAGEGAAEEAGDIRAAQHRAVGDARCWGGAVRDNGCFLSEVPSGGGRPWWCGAAARAVWCPRRDAGGPGAGERGAAAGRRRWRRGLRPPRALRG